MRATSLVVLFHLLACAAAPAQEENPHEYEDEMRRVSNLGGDYARAIVAVSFYESQAFTGEDLKGLYELGQNLRYLRALDLRKSGLTPNGLRNVGRAFANLRELRLGHVGLTDKDLAELVPIRRHRPLENLRSLELSDMSLTGQGLHHLQHLIELRRLDLSRTRLTPQGVRNVLLFRSLRELIVDGTPIDNEAVAALVTLPKLESLSVGKTKISGDAALAKHGPGPTQRKLRSLDVSETRVDDTLLEHFCKWSPIRHLDVHDTQVTAAGLLKLKAAGEKGWLPELTELVVSAKQVDRETCLALMEAIPNLKIRIMPGAKEAEDVFEFNLD